MKRKEKVTEFTTYRLIKNEDLNHHLSLFAGFGLSFLVENAFVAAASVCNPEYLRFIHCSEMSFTSPVHLGEILKLSSRIVHIGNTSITTYVNMSIGTKFCGDGFLTFVQIRPYETIDEKGEKIIKYTSVPVDVELELLTEEDKQLNEKAIQLKKNTSHGKRS